MQPSEHARAADPVVGRILDRRYRIGARIARGGMASVYEATDLRLDRTVAVKVMHPGLGDDDDFAQRFVREARAAARLNHPSVVGVFDQGDDDGTVFLAMEYVPGHTLRDLVRKEAPMTPARALAVMEPVVSALAAAHRAGLVHRDVKPENVLIADDGRIKVADFGLAKAVSADTQHTATGGVLIGTVSYLAPELVVDGRADARADVYATGVVLYELLTGRKPHEGESPIQVAYKHVHEDVPPPSQDAPGIPDYVDALVARATSRDRSQRPADAGVLLHQVHRVAQALREGLTSDEELTRDLAPRAILPEDTTPDPFDGYPGDDHERTTAIEELRPVVAPAAAVAAKAPAGGLDSTRPATARPAGSGSAPSRPSPSRPTAVPTVARRRSRKGPIVFLLSLLLVAGLGVGAWWFGYARYTTTPGVLGLDEAAATATLERAGLQAETAEPAYSETVPAGLVLSTDPEPGHNVIDGGTVELVISLGPERYEVPKLAGMTEDEAQDALLAGHLAFGESTDKWSEKVPAGQVIRSHPPAGKSLPPDTPVDLVLSKGRKPITVKDFTGQPLERATAALKHRKLLVKVLSEEYSDTVPEGHVISQTPSSGTLHRGDTVGFVVSRGPELVEVPGTTAMGVEAATEKLEALGFVVRTEQSDSYIGVGFVFSSDPAAGEMVPKGSTITLYLL